MPEKNSSAFDIFDLLSGSDEKESSEPEEAESNQRAELLASTKAKDLFPKGTVTINKYSCVGVQCKYCIKACPTNALYWTNEGVGIIEDLCLHCQACVLSCMVDNCIKVTRKRDEKTDEQFSKTRDTVKLSQKISGKKRFTRVNDALPSLEHYCKKYNPKKGTQP
jgi:Na+-translocating ferredoxin:NAD+ oxidoreductase RNF subunit RnfB